MTYEEVDRVMNKESGVLGISDVSNDFRVISKKLLLMVINAHNWH